MSRAYLVQPLYWYYNDFSYSPDDDAPAVAAFATRESAEAYRVRLDREIASGERPAPPGLWREAGAGGYPMPSEPFSNFEVIEVPWED